jgi:hypothetical protein
MAACLIDRGSRGRSSTRRSNCSASASSGSPAATPTATTRHAWPTTPCTSSCSSGILSFAKTPFGGQVVDLSALITPRSGDSCSSGRRSLCLQEVDPRDNSTASRQIPFPIRSPACRRPLRGTRDPARVAERHSHLPACQPGRCQRASRAGQASASRAGTPRGSLTLPASPHSLDNQDPVPLRVTGGETGLGPARGKPRPSGRRSRTWPAGPSARGDRGLDAIPAAPES